MLYKSIVILGLKHSGKSTLGKRLAQNLGYDFFDTDELIEKNCKMSVRKLYNLRGSEAFKYEEEKACLQIAEMFKTKKIVTATGGGICENPQAMMHLRSADVFVFLKNDLTLSAERILRKIGIDEKGCFTGVPAFIKEKNPQSLEEIRSLLIKKFQERAKIYTSSCDIIVELQNAPIEENLQRLIEKLN